MTTSLLDLPIGELAEGVKGGRFGAEELVEESLRRIEAGRELGAFLHVSAEAARRAARELDARRARGEALGPLAGVPVAVKDSLCTLDAPTTCASRILERAPGDGWRSPYDATAVARLRAADAVIIGKTNLDEFAMGSSTTTGAFGPALSPWDRTRVAGGSSGGSAVSVAAGLTPGALGSDTGGSVRQPAALSGVLGVKPSAGRVSRYGLVAFASSLDQIGPLARDARSAALLLEVIAGADPSDSTSARRPVGRYQAACDAEARGLRVGVPAEYFAEGLDPLVRASVEAALKGLEAAGMTLEPVALPHTRYGVATYYVLATAEASSNLARFDGVRFGRRDERPGDELSALYGRTRAAGFGAEVKRRILLGTYVLSAGYYDAYYVKAERARALIQQDFDRAFARVDVIATPASPTPAWRLDEHPDDPLAAYLADAYTLPASLAGLAGLSVPCEPTPASATRPALPVGLQLLAPAFAEERLFTVAAAWERLSPAPRRRPPEAGG
ncbi:MAG: Asp-tRNA(Asn)/Glu-tRNA(Gln) amidotransferase subunit GatA [Sorangiineae bacterium]|nr:Asp-tRNA(Asn)/Glu-tRNA(Gln) amidotransferase subunit GatA [Polyangiaceae bacterium]MEB2324981.1 Asp-tRNA(Asn)/Glu-tRNA(Gln) amidotransferase subunit GatA [Sorangiineae bacterium]